MKLEKQVCTLEQAKRLKELGIEQQSHFTWYEVSDGSDEGNPDAEGVEWYEILAQKDHHRMMDMAVYPVASDLTTSDGEFCSTRGIYSAFTVAELGAMLPTAYDTMRTAEGWRGYGNQGYDYPTEEVYENESEPRAVMLIHLLENNNITATDCNNRLKQ